IDGPGGRAGRGLGSRWRATARQQQQRQQYTAMYAHLVMLLPGTGLCNTVRAADIGRQMAGGIYAAPTPLDSSSRTRGVRAVSPRLCRAGASAPDPAGGRYAAPTPLDSSSRTRGVRAVSPRLCRAGASAPDPAGGIYAAPTRISAPPPDPAARPCWPGTGQSTPR